MMPNVILNKYKCCWFEILFPKKIKEKEKVLVAYTKFQNKKNEAKFYL
jgi:hypothetical protein